MKERGRRSLWWPFTQHDDVAADDITVLDSAYGDYYCAVDVKNRDGEKVSMAWRVQMPSRLVVFFHSGRW